MDQNKAVKIEIGFNGNKLNLDLPFKDYLSLSEYIKMTSKGWYQIALDRNSFTDIDVSQVLYIKMRSSEVKALTKRDGYTLKSICKVMGVNYDVFRQKIKAEGIELDRGTERRILLTPRTITNLNLSQSQISKIKNGKTNV